ncbi:MAG: TadE/TadG family type IV pilus assembly protein [Planctomycetota bacterium]
MAGFTACGAVALVALWGLLGRFRLARAFALHRDRRGTTIVEFPLALIVLVLMSLLTWQLGFLVSAYVLVDYAAFAAAPVATAQIPPRLSAQDPPHVVRDIPLAQSDKGDRIREAAAFVCYPISASYTADDSWTSEVPVLQELKKLPGVGDFLEDLGAFDFATRYAYALRNTSARLVVEGQDAGEHAFTGGSLVTVEVTHVFSLRIAIAARILGSQDASGGYVAPVTGRATLLYEGFGELVPAGAPSGAQP